MYIVYKMSDFFRKEKINVYVIDKDTKIYRGDKSDVNPQDKLSKEYLFFTPKMDQAKQYGIVSEFETNKPLRVVALDDITEDFYKSAPEDVKKYLVSNYGYNTDDKLRNTNETGDFHVSQYICDQGYDGYAIDTMATDAGGKFHQEIVICNPSVNVKFVNKVMDEEHQKEMEEKEFEERLKPQRKKRPVVLDIEEETNDSMPLSGSLFGDMNTPEKTPLKEDAPDSPDSVFEIPKLSFADAFDSPPSSPMKGAKRKSKMKKAKRKSKRRTKKSKQ